jgi:hypothetical protein
MKYGIINSVGKLVAIFSDESMRDVCYECVFDVTTLKGYARVKVEDGVCLK